MDAWPTSLVIVDDDRYIVSLLDEVFQQEGLAVRSFTSSVEAQAHLAGHTPDIVITDIKMPDVTGLDLLREIHARAPETMVIIITGYSSLQTTLEAVQLGAFDYITKPFLLGEVKLVVQRAAEQLQLRRENRRLIDRVSELEDEVGELRRQFEAITRDFTALDAEMRARRGEARQVFLPQPPLALKPYAAQAETPRSRYSAKLDLLEDLHRRGVLSDPEFESARRRLAEATGQSGAEGPR
ncbi:MAG: response regulator [Candidatus Sumerlaeia bacterium]|nr:response regulator [Candidatus Sumerlaeia bacterium]